MRYLITVEYNGKNYSGWQNQKNSLAVQQVIEENLSKLLKEPIKLFGSGRTDSGVHALNQKAHFDTNNGIDMRKIPLALNTQLPMDIRIKNIEQRNENFHAQYSAKRKIYLYKFYVSRILSPIREEYYAQVVPQIDFDIMQKGAELIKGEHDFKAFSSTGSGIKTTTRTIYRIDLKKANDEIFLEIEGNGFLYNMVRIIAGTLVFLAKGKLTLQDIEQALATGDRKKAGKTFPAHALYLKDVLYD